MNVERSFPNIARAGPLAILAAYPAGLLASLIASSAGLSRAVAVNLGLLIALFLLGIVYLSARVVVAVAQNRLHGTAEADAAATHAPSPVNEAAEAGDEILPTTGVDRASPPAVGKASGRRPRMSRVQKREQRLLKLDERRRLWLAYKKTLGIPEYPPISDGRPRRQLDRRASRHSDS